MDGECMKLKRMPGLVVSIVGAAGIGLVVTGSPASATPQNCTHGRASTGSAIAYCASGTGEFVSRIQCKVTIGGDTYYKSGYGSYEKAGGGVSSISYCPRWDSSHTMTYYTDSIILS
jgi:hypothetical protein